MKTVKTVYINGEFVTPHGTQMLDLISPVTGQKTAEATLADEVDTQNAIAAARAALKTFSMTTKEERLALLEKLRSVITRRQKDLTDIMVEEYGGTYQFCSYVSQNAIDDFTAMIDTLKEFEFERTVGHSKLLFQPKGVVGFL